MAAGQGTDVAQLSGKSPETLSQFVAKILDQLSISAWLPSAALVLSVALVVNLDSARGSLGDAVSAFSDYSVADGLFLFAAVIVLTVVTQAFEFAAIRVLEGYWGPSRIAQLGADLGCWYHERRRDRLERRRKKWSDRAFKVAYYRLSEMVHESPQTTTVTARDLDILMARRKGNKLQRVSRAELVHALNVRWEAQAPPRFIRREEFLREAVKRYPRDHRVLPTTLGNILRAYEDLAFPKLGGDALSGAVQRVRHLLPVEVAAEHDQHRSRLDLYCSLVFVALTVTAVAVLLLQDRGVRYLLAIVLVGVSAVILSYRAAIATAEAYGGILRIIGSMSGADKPVAKRRS